jgi:hypothetical protein
MRMPESGSAEIDPTREAPIFRSEAGGEEVALRAFI